MSPCGVFYHMVVGPRATIVEMEDKVISPRLTAVHFYKMVHYHLRKNENGPRPFVRFSANTIIVVFFFAKESL